MSPDDVKRFRHESGVACYESGAHAVAVGFPERLRQLRRARELSQETLAEAAGLARNQVSRYERGENAPGAEAVQRLAAALGVTTEDLLGPVSHSEADIVGESAVLSVGGYRVRMIPIRDSELPEAVVRRYPVLETSTVLHAGVWLFPLGTDRVGYRRGDLLLVDPEAEAVPGDLVVASVMGGPPDLYVLEIHGERRVLLAELGAAPTWADHEVLGVAVDIVHRERSQMRRR